MKPELGRLPPTGRRCHGGPTPARMCSAPSPSPSVNRGAVALLPPSTWVIGGERPCPERHAIPSPCSVSGSRRVAPPSAGPSDRTTDAATQWSTSPPSNCGGCDSASPPLPQLGGEVLGVAERRLPRRAEARAGLTLLGGVGWCRPGRPSAAGQCRGDLPVCRLDSRCYTSTKS